MPRFPIACLAILSSVSLAPAKSYIADRYDVRIQVLPDASLLVTETIRFHFEEGHFTYVSRVLPERRTDGISVIRTAIDDAPVAEPDVEEGDDGIRVRWHFDAGDDSVHDFTLTYRVAGAIRTEPGRDVLEWRSLPQQHDYTILAGQVAVEYPAAEELLAPPEMRVAISAHHEAHRSVFRLPELGPDRDAILRAAFRTGFAMEPAWQAAEDQRRARAGAAWSTGALAALLFTAIGIWALARYRGTLPPRPRVLTANPSGEFPADLPPAVTARLLGSSSGAPVPAALGTLLDLARRGIVAIRQSDRRAFGQKAWLIEPRAAAPDLLPFEDALLSLAFVGEFPPKPADFAAFLSKLSTSPGAFSRPLEQHMLALRLLDPDRLRIRNHGILVTLLVSLGGLLACGAGVAWSVACARSGDSLLPVAAVAAGLGAAAFVIGLAGLILSARVSPLTPEGAGAAQSWRGFRERLVAITRQKGPASPDEFERFLPFATAFGLGASWVRRFRKSGAVPAPVWFEPAFEMDQGSADLAFFDFVAAGSAAADSASMGGGGSDGGGGSAAGGGSSSAG